MVWLKLFDSLVDVMPVFVLMQTWYDYTQSPKYLHKALHVQLFQCKNLVINDEYTIWVHINNQARTCSIVELLILK